MAGHPKSREKEQAARKQIQEKSKLTREELKGQLLKGIRAEQLDTVAEDALTTKNRISRLSSVGATKALERGLVKESNIVGQLPPRWNRLLSSEFTIEDWKIMEKGPEECKTELPSPKTLKMANEPKLNQRFKSAVYDDEETLALIHEAYCMGVQDANTTLTSNSCLSPISQMKNLADIQRRVIEFLLEDYGEQINPILHLTPRELVERVTLYFIECDLTKKFYTVPGLAFYIGFSTRDEFHEYVSQNPDSILAYILRRAMTYIESETVTDMMYGGGMMTGHKINLATNFNYSDAGRKNETKDSSPAITINNNSITMQGVPPKPESIEEWQAWYVKEQAAKNTAALPEQPAVIDVATS